MRVNMALHIYRRLNLSQKFHVRAAVYLFDKIVGKSKIYLRKDHVKYSASLHALTDTARSSISHVRNFYQIIFSACTLL